MLMIRSWTVRGWEVVWKFDSNVGSTDIDDVELWINMSTVIFTSLLKVTIKWIIVGIHFLLVDAEEWYCHQNDVDEDMLWDNLENIFSLIDKEIGKLVKKSKTKMHSIGPKIDVSKHLWCLHKIEKQYDW